METEFIKDKVYYKIFDRTYSSLLNDLYHKHKSKDASILSQIKQNIDNIQQKFGVKDLITLKQVHSNKVVCADNNINDEEADALFTTQKGIALGILTADCVPLLLASDDGTVVGAAHCGWKGAKNDIISNLYQMMVDKGAQKVKALIGPAIQQKSYEVSADYYNNFIRDDLKYKNMFVNSYKKDHYMFDLPAYVKLRLEQENIEITVDINEDTYELEDKYPSFRRATHRNEQYNQNILSTIMIK